MMMKSFKATETRLLVLRDEVFEVHVDIPFGTLNHPALQKTLSECLCVLMSERGARGAVRTESMVVSPLPNPSPQDALSRVGARYRLSMFGRELRVNPLRLNLRVELTPLGTAMNSGLGWPDDADDHHHHVDDRSPEPPATSTMQEPPSPPPQSFGGESGPVSRRSSSMSSLSLKRARGRTKTTKARGFGERISRAISKFIPDLSELGM